MIMEEIWKDVVGYEGIYKISSMGNLKSVERIDSLGHKRKEKILKPKTDKYGYIVYGLCKNGKLKSITAHRLVAEAFIPNPENKECVDHINTIRTDNRVWLNDDGSVNYEKTNLRWCTQKENHNNPLSVINHGVASCIPVIQYSLDGYMLKVWDSALMAEINIGVRHQGIAKCCKNRYGHKSAGGFKWKYYTTDNYLIGKLNNSLMDKGFSLRKAS